MKPCLNKRKRIAWLALGELDAGQAQDLHAHLENCAGCRAYLKEISDVTEQLAAAQIESVVRASESFHQQVVGRLRAEATASVWETVSALLRGPLLNWRVALPVVGATAVVIAVLFFVVPRPGVRSPEQTGPQAVSSPKPKRDPQPTIANYQMIANQSLEKLDELLTRQSNRALPPMPIYTASTLALAKESF